MRLVVWGGVGGYEVYDIMGFEEALMFLTVETLPLFSSSRLCLLNCVDHYGTRMKHALHITEKMDGTDEGFSYRESRVRESAIG